MDWQKELERSLASQGQGGDQGSLYDNTAHHFGSLLQRQAGAGAGADRYYRAPPPPQWPASAAQMAWMSQHSMWMSQDPSSSFRQFFTEHPPAHHQQQAGFRGWEAGPDTAKTLEAAQLTSAQLTSAAEQPLNYRTQPEHSYPHQTAAESLVTYEKSPLTYEQSPAAYEKSPATYEKSPAAYEKSPLTYEKSPATYEKSPEEEQSPGHTGQEQEQEQEQEEQPRQGRTSPDYTGGQDGDTGHQEQGPAAAPGPVVYPSPAAGDTETAHSDPSPSDGSNIAVTVQRRPTADQETVSAMEEEESSPQELPKDLSCDRMEVEKEKHNICDEASHHYDAIKNMTEQYGGIKTEDGFETRKHNLESVLSKMNKPGDDMAQLEAEDDDESCSNHHMEELQKSPVKSEQDVYDFDSEPKFEQKPIKLKIARGEIVANTALETHTEEEVGKGEKEKEGQSSTRKSPPWAIKKDSILKLHEKLSNDAEMKDKVQGIVGEDVLEIFASAVEEAEAASDDLIENKNVVFLHYAVKNSTNLYVENIDKDKTEPLSNLALSIPLLQHLLQFLNKDHNIKDQIKLKIGKDELEYYEATTLHSVRCGDEFLQDAELAPRMVTLYHSVRNLVLGEAFSRLTSLYSKVEHILHGVENTEVELETNLREVGSFTITEKAPTRDREGANQGHLLTEPTRAFTFKTTLC